MILSFHPCYEADANIICAGREPDDKDRSAILAASAVVLPQGCKESLYRLARRHCRHVFPNYDARFNYPGKIGQAKLFHDLNAPHPRTWIFEDSAHFKRCGDAALVKGFPLVFKLDWGGEGETVFLLKDRSDLDEALARARAYEKTGQPGFIVQRFVPHANQTLRVVVIGQTLRSYWRIQDSRSTFGTSLSHGARIDAEANPHLRRKTIENARRFCRQAHINLAGLDYIFAMGPHEPEDPPALLLEINYFFGRIGLGGSERFYTLLQAEIDRWLRERGLTVDRTKYPPSTGKM